MKTLKNRIEKHLTTKSGEIKSKYRDAIWLIENPKSESRTTYWSGNGKRQNLVDNSHNVVMALRIIGVDFECGNDAPKGGRNGDYVKLTAKGRKQVAYYNKQRVIEIKEQEAKAEIEKIKHLKLHTKLAVKSIVERYNRLQELDELSEEKLMVDFFQNEIHPAPQEVYDLKKLSGKSWNELRDLYC